MKPMFHNESAPQNSKKRVENRHKKLIEMTANIKFLRSRLPNWVLAAVTIDICFTFRIISFSINDKKVHSK